MLTEAGGLERECWGEERTTGGIPLAGLVPGPLPPANWHEEEKEKRERFNPNQTHEKEAWKASMTQWISGFAEYIVLKTRGHVFMALTSK